MGLAKTYHLFRTLGLRHLFVVPSVTEISGVITRKVHHNPTQAACDCIRRICCLILQKSGTTL